MDRDQANWYLNCCDVQYLGTFEKICACCLVMDHVVVRVFSSNYHRVLNADGVLTTAPGPLKAKDLRQRKLTIFTVRYPDLLAVIYLTRATRA